jgi:hypothetical protein
MNNDEENKNIILNEAEENLLMDHNYDGIEEFDYPLPSWWVWTFIGGGFFAVFYIFFYNFAGAPSLKEEYKKELPIKHGTNHQKVCSKLLLFMKRIACHVTKRKERVILVPT